MTRINRTVAAELAAMVGEDQRIRMAMTAAGGERLTLAQRIEWAQIDVGNTDRLRQIVEEYGWPGWSLVGKRGAHDAWLLAQHADKQLGFQRCVLGLLAEAVRTGDAEPRHLAYLTDRVRMNEGRKQLYGTQMHADDGQPFAPWPIEDPDHVEARRAEMGLEPLPDYIASFNE